MQSAPVARRLLTFLVFVGACCLLFIHRKKSAAVNRTMGGALRASHRTPLPVKGSMEALNSDVEAVQKLVGIPRSLAEASAATGLWLQHLGDNTKCFTTCGNGRCRKLDDQATCQALAISRAHPFYSWRADKRQCATTQVCNSPVTGTIADWKVFRISCHRDLLLCGDGTSLVRDPDLMCDFPACPVQNATTTTTTLAPVLWPQHSGDNTKCVVACGQGRCQKLVDQAACQALAISRAHPFYSWRADKRQCATTQHCDSLVTGTVADWKVFRISCHRDLLLCGDGISLGRDPDLMCEFPECPHTLAPTAAPTVAPTPDVWPRFGDDKTKCHGSCQGVCTEVPSIIECQALAEGRGHQFFSFTSSPTGGRCATTADCNSATTGTQLDWQVFRRPVQNPIMVLFKPLGEACSNQGEIVKLLGESIPAESCKALCREDPACFFATFQPQSDVDAGVCTAMSTCSETAVSNPSNGIIVWSKVTDTSTCQIESDGGVLRSLPDCRPEQLVQCIGRDPVLTTECMTEEKYDEVSKTVENILNGLPNACDNDFCPQADWAGCILRMAGHDFMDFHDGRGGSDACTDMRDLDNVGLATCLANGEFGVSISDAYNFHCHEVSLADFLVIAAEAVMTATRARAIAEDPSRIAFDFRGQFKFGRTTAGLNCDFTQGWLPNPEDSCPAVERVFMEGGMGLTVAGAAALMGVHSLGRARPHNSGYNGWWSDPENSRRFNNDYYISIVAKGWMPEPAVGGDPQKNQWKRGDQCRVGGRTDGQAACGASGATAPAPNAHEAHQMMLNTDICLAYTDRHHNVDSQNGVLQAHEDHCCTWVHSKDLRQHGMRDIIKANGNSFCGVKCGLEGGDPCGDDGFEFEACCSLVDSPEGHADCGDPAGLGLAGTGSDPQTSSGGLATEAVFRFASNEVAWVEEFLEAWGIATTNGFQLRALGACGPDVSATVAPTPEPTVEPTPEPTPGQATAPTIAPTPFPTPVPTPPPLCTSPCQVKVDRSLEPFVPAVVRIKVGDVVNWSGFSSPAFHTIIQRSGPGCTGDDVCPASCVGSTQCSSLPFEDHSCVAKKCDGGFFSQPPGGCSGKENNGCAGEWSSEFSLTFTESGTYTYSCGIHFDQMPGMVIVEP